jgi:hypothetical protein
VAQNDPLSTLLPKPPLPRPDRREAAINEAMRRFDGAAEAPSVTDRASREKRTWLATPWARPQLGAVLATALVGLVALPLWMPRDRHPELTSPAASSLPVAPAVPDHATPKAGSSSPARLEAIPAATNDEAGLATAPSLQTEEAAVADRSEKAEAPPKAVGALASGSAAQPDEAIVAVSRRAEPQAPPAIVLAEPVAAPVPPPPAAAAMGRAAAADLRERDDVGNDVIVTARRVDSASSRKASAPPRGLQARRTSRPGDWNACTVNDPTRSLGACTEPLSGHVAEGLSRAWRGDLDGAIAAFDRAIAASPEAGLAYLNRGLAYERKGARDRAFADLDRAVRQRPNSARAHYNRSLALYRRGEKDRAAADAARAVELDPRYSAVIR